MVLLVVDAQKEITNDRLYKYREYIDNVSTLISESRENGVEVIYIRHDDGIGKLLTKGTPGFEICDEFAPAENEKIFDKSVKSPFRSSGLLEYLKEKGKKRIIVTGLMTDYCIDATVKCGFEHGFEVIVPEYCNSTFDNKFMSAQESYEYYNEFIWKNRYAKCISVNETIKLIEENK